MLAKVARNHMNHGPGLKPAGEVFKGERMLLNSPAGERTEELVSVSYHKKQELGLGMQQVLRGFCKGSQTHWVPISTHTRLMM